MILSLTTSGFPVLHSRLDIDGEATVPAWYSSVLLFCIGLCSLGLHFMRRAAVPKESSYFWLVFGSVFFFLSLDESARIHEIFDEQFQIKWIFFYAPFAAIFFIYSMYYLFLRERDKRLSLWALTGLLIFGLGGLGTEAYTYFVPSGVAENVVEESLEMIGAIILLVGCMQGVIHSSN
jgi:hypothetical protein